MQPPPAWPLRSRPHRVCMRPWQAGLACDPAFCHPCISCVHTRRLFFLPCTHSWGDMSILDAEKALLREALLDPLNVK